MRIVFTAYWETALDTPAVGLADTPEIRIRRLDTDALVVTDDTMTETGDGWYKYIYTTPVEGVSFSARADGDPNVTGQVLTGSRYQTDSGDNFAGEVWQNEGLDPANPKVINVNSDVDMDEDVDQIHKDSVTAGTTTTQTRT